MFWFKDLEAFEYIFYEKDTFLLNPQEHFSGTAGIRQVNKETSILQVGK